MGLLVNGEWRDEWYDTEGNKGRFVRQASAFRNAIRADGSTPYLPESGRYHLYVSLACPWAHRTLIFRKLKKLEKVISVSVVDPHMGSEGWVFSDARDATSDPVNGARRLYEIYTMAESDFTGRVTVPVLWDKKTGTIVNNESAEIIRMLNADFGGMGDDSLDFYPAGLRQEIDALNEIVYSRVNNGVYRCGFATTQEAYEEAFELLFATLDELDHRLAKQRYLLGDVVTEADWRLFTTLVRFDAVYVGHFKCNKQRISDTQNLSGYLRELYQWPGVAETVNFDHIKRHYYESHNTINPTGIVPAGPDLHLDAPHQRGAL